MCSYILLLLFMVMQVTFNSFSLKLDCVFLWMHICSHMHRLFCICFTFLCYYISLCNTTYLYIIGFINSNESLFTYNQQIDQSWETFYDLSFQPIFEVTQQSQFIQSICGNNTFCYYDYAVTGNTDIALSTLNGSNLYDEIVRLSYPGIVLIMYTSY